MAGAGAVLFDPSGQKIWEGARPLGRCTNNEAEYRAALLLLEEAFRRGASDLELLGDSKLVIHQLSGAWKIKEPRLRVLAEEFKRLASGLSIKFTWIPRSDNSDADRMANLAMDGQSLDLPLDQEDMGNDDSSQEPEPSPVLEAAVVSLGGEQFLVDLVRKRCSCDDFARKGDCVHLAFCLGLVYTKS